MGTFGTWRGSAIHLRVVGLVTAPELATTTTEDVESDATTLTEAHQDEVAVGTTLRVVAHLGGTVESTLVGALAPTISAIHGPVCDVLIAASIGRAF
jgi:hypothetical protein